MNAAWSSAERVGRQVHRVQRGFSAFDPVGENHADLVPSVHVAELAAPLAERCRADACCRHSPGTGVPASACFSAAMIWLSVNRDFFMEPPRVRPRENSTSGVVYLAGGLPKLKERIADKEFREGRRISLIEVAAETGIGRITLSRILNRGNHVRSDTFDRLCTYFDCRIEELVEHVSDEPVAGAKKTRNARHG